MPHDWRLMDETPGIRYDYADDEAGGSVLVGRFVVRRWYCTRCREFETTEHPPRHAGVSA